MPVQLRGDFGLPVLIDEIWYKVNNIIRSAPIERSVIGI